jgi:hypothetical protein
MLTALDIQILNDSGTGGDSRTSRNIPLLQQRIHFPLDGTPGQKRVEAFVGKRGVRKPSPQLLQYSRLAAEAG